MEEQGNHRHANCAVKMMNECEGSQNMKIMKFNDDQNMNNEQFDDVAVTPSVSISSKVARTVTFYGAGGNHNTGMSGIVDGAGDDVAKCMLGGDTSKKGGDTVPGTDEKHKGGLCDDNVRMVGDVGQGGGVDGDQPVGVD